MKTSELIGPALDWAVEKCEWLYPFLHKNPYGYWVMPNLPGSYSTDWSQGGPIIEREGIRTERWRNTDAWVAQMSEAVEYAGFKGYHRTSGPTPLVAAMRCFVASKLGNEVEIPEELK
jgi:hypothetical protein